MSSLVAACRPLPMVHCLLCVGGVMLAGCAGPLNHQPELGGTVTADGLSGTAFNPDSVALESFSEGFRPGSGSLPPLDRTTGDQPSISSLERTNWPMVRFLVPVDGTQHQPTYASGPSYDRSTHRARGEFPTVDTAAVAHPNDAGREAQIWEAMAWPFWAGLDVALLLPRMLYTAPGSTVRSPLVTPARSVPGDAPPMLIAPIEPSLQATDPAEGAAPSPGPAAPPTASPSAPPAPAAAPRS
ncbi:MAG: hypothetical protein LW650_05200 [Planctomycetaceae bacterium]|nr:hypothetical protein [Phycisphaerales bacterium]MCE2652904.1 hypothetical protein [Planctomycetaceae bacterium]